MVAWAAIWILFEITVLVGFVIIGIVGFKVHILDISVSHVVDTTEVIVVESRSDVCTSRCVHLVSCVFMSVLKAVPLPADFLPT